MCLRLLLLLLLCVRFHFAFAVMFRYVFYVFTFCIYLLVCVAFYAFRSVFLCILFLSLHRVKTFEFSIECGGFAAAMGGARVVGGTVDWMVTQQKCQKKNNTNTTTTSSVLGTKITKLFNFVSLRCSFLSFSFSAGFIMMFLCFTVGSANAVFAQKVKDRHTIVFVVYLLLLFFVYCFCCN